MTSPSIPFVLVPLDIEDAMLAAGTTIAEPAAGETAWVSAGSYTVGDKRIRTTTHRVYKALTTHTGITTLPENDTVNWYDYGPTQRWAPFDSYVSTAAADVTSMTYVIEPGFINAVALYGLIGGVLEVTYKDAPGGTTIHSETISLIGSYVDEWDYCFGPYRQKDRAVITDLPAYPGCELMLTVTSDIGDPVAIGMIAMGDMRPLVLGNFGGTQYGAQLTPKTYSYIKTAEDGTTSIKRRHSGTDMEISVFLPHSDADFAVATLQEVIDIPAAFIATTAEGYDGFSIFGLASGVRRAEGPTHETLSVSVKGMI